MRLVFFLLVVLLIASVPYWIYLPVILIGIVMFPFYLEAILFGFIVDALYGIGDGYLSGITFAVIATLLVYFVVPLREHLRFNV